MHWNYLDSAGHFSRDLFWEEKVAWRQGGDRTPDGGHCLRIGGRHYVAIPGVVDPRPFMGHGGARLRWRDSSGNAYESNDVWSQGDIPEGFRDRLPDNAKWIPGWWCGGCQEYHVGLHCPNLRERLEHPHEATGHA